MLSPRLRQRLSELARSPAPPLPVVASRSGRSPTPDGQNPPASPPSCLRASSLPEHPSPEPPAPCPVTGDPESGTGPPVSTPECSVDTLPLLLLPFDPATLGAAMETECGPYFRLSVDVTGEMDDGPERTERLRAGAARLGVRPETLLLVDIETAGLTAAPLFLVGALTLGPDRLTLTQYFARGYEEEAALLHAFSASLGTCRMVVTFNGQTFDLPYLCDRAIYHRLPPPLFPDHLDLLPAARRRWRGTLPNCRLLTLEQQICRRRRIGDVPGEVIPQLYHDFVRTGHWPLLLPVFHHNALDLLTLAELLPHLLDA
jgi:uncharacterized protein YprB with RNaseH-like and TPR domain